MVRSGGMVRNAAIQGNLFKIIISSTGYGSICNEKLLHSLEQQLLHTQMKMKEGDNQKVNEVKAVGY